MTCQIMLNLLHFNFFINFVCVTSRLIYVVCMCVSNKVVKRKTYECLVFLPFRKMLTFWNRTYGFSNTINTGIAFKNNYQSRLLQRQIPSCELGK